MGESVDSTQVVSDDTKQLSLLQSIVKNQKST